MTSNDKDICLSFKCSNTIRNKVVTSKHGNYCEAVVYCTPCLNCDQSYIGESGRGLGKRLEEHKRACRLGNSYSAAATHTLNTGHRIGFNNVKIVYKSKNRNQRRVIEGALISLNNTFENNKGNTNEDKYFNTQICSFAGIK